MGPELHYSSVKITIINIVNNRQTIRSHFANRKFSSLIFGKCGNEHCLRLLQNAVISAHINCTRLNNKIFVF